MDRRFGKWTSWLLCTLAITGLLEPVENNAILGFRSFYFHSPWSGWLPFTFYILAKSVLREFSVHRKIAFTFYETHPLLWRQVVIQTAFPFDHKYLVGLLQPLGSGHWMLAIVDMERLSLLLMDPYGNENTYLPVILRQWKCVLIQVYIDFWHILTHFTETTWHFTDVLRKNGRLNQCHTHYKWMATVVVH
jgi:hypothetical protein